VTKSLDPVALREVYDAELRAWVPAKLPPQASIDHDGPVLRVVGLDNRGFVTYRSLAGLTGAEVDVLIARQRDFFAARGEGVEWKLHGHDEPADLAGRLVAAGFVPEAQETVVIGRAGPLAATSAESTSVVDRSVADRSVVAQPIADQSVEAHGVRLREVTARADLERMAEIWSADRSYLVSSLEDELAADPTGITVVVAEVSPDIEASPGVEAGPGVEASPGTVVSAGWVRYVHGTAFATLWGGSTLPEWRGRGIYKALVRYRARLAVARGFEYLQVDASDDSRPILERNGFIPVTTTTPYVHTPS
jgi:GNAT superfamily N-acetyltransferase